MFDAVDTEGAKVDAQFAPGGEGPRSSPKIKSQRMHAANAGLAVFARVGEQNNATLLRGGVERIELTAEFSGGLEPGSVEQNVVDFLAQAGGENRFDLAQSAIGRFSEFGASPSFHHAGTEDESGDFFAIKHERRDIEVAAQRIANAGFAGNGHAGELQVLDIAIDGAMRDLQLLGEAARGLQAATAQQLHNAEESVGTTHGDILEVFSSARRAACASCGSMQTDAVSLRIANLRDPSDAGDVVLGLDDAATGLLHAAKNLVDAAVAVEVDDGAVG